MEVAGGVAARSGGGLVSGGDTRVRPEEERGFVLFRASGSSNRAGWSNRRPHDRGKWQAAKRKRRSGKFNLFIVGEELKNELQMSKWKRHLIPFQKKGILFTQLEILR